MADRKLGCLSIFLFVALCASMFVNLVLVAAMFRRVGGVVQPSDRKVHLVPTPTMGGLAMYLGFAAGLAASRLLPYFREMNASSSEPWAALLACTLIVALGVVDDLRGITWLTKLKPRVSVEADRSMHGKNIYRLIDNSRCASGDKISCGN